MSLDMKDDWSDACGVTVNSVLLALKSNLRVVSANYHKESGKFFVKTSSGNWSFGLVFDEDDVPGDAGHA